MSAALLADLKISLCSQILSPLVLPSRSISEIRSVARRHCHHPLEHRTVIKDSEGLSRGQIADSPLKGLRVVDLSSRDSDLRRLDLGFRGLDVGRVAWSVATAVSTVC